MAYYYHGNPLTLVGTPVKGEGKLKGQCAQLVQWLVPGLTDRFAYTWVRGTRVWDNHHLRTGTAIAIFDSNGRYAGAGHHSTQHGVAHAALYVSQTSVGIWVVHQFSKCPVIRRAFIRLDGQESFSKEKNTPEDYAGNYYVIK